MEELKTIIEIEPQPKKEYGFNIRNIVDSPVDIEEKPQRKRGPGRPPSKNTSIISTTNTYTDDTIVKANKSQSPEAQYEKAYAGNSKLLYGAIAQSEQIIQGLESEIADMREHPAKGGKMRGQIMNEFINTQVSAINTKITALRELNNVRHKINEFILKKQQLDKDSLDDNSDKAVMDAYYAFINSSNYGLPRAQPPLAPTTINTGVNLGGTQVQSNVLSTSPIITANGNDTSFESYKANLTPIQRKMILDNDPNIKTVVVYDQNSGMKYFDVINVQTGESIPGVTRPAEILLDAMRIDARNGVAVNSNVNQIYPLVIIGSRVADEL